VLTPAVPGALAWAASSSGAAASTAMESGAVKDSVPSVLHSCRMSTKNASKTQPLAVFQQSLSLSAVGPASTPRVRRLHAVQASFPGEETILTMLLPAITDALVCRIEDSIQP
jgi:hypothetical protein